jgi:hypothetical protein
MRQLGRNIREFAAENENIMPAPWHAPLSLMDATAIGGYEPCCNVPKHYSHVIGRTEAKFAFLTAYSQFNSRRRPLNLRQHGSRFKRQSDTLVPPIHFCALSRNSGYGIAVFLDYRDDQALLWCSQLNNG